LINSSPQSRELDFEQVGISDSCKMLVAKNAVILSRPTETLGVFNVYVGFKSVRKIRSSDSDLLFAVAESTPQAHYGESGGNFKLIHEAALSNPAPRLRSHPLLTLQRPSLRPKQQPDSNHHRNSTIHSPSNLAGHKAAG
jgi:hypothetical protein